MNEISTLDLKKLFDQKKKFILIDCRGVDYFNWEHIKGAINLRWKYVQEKADKILPDKNALVITSCDGFTCFASIKCFDNLKKAGYKNLIEYSGGIADWKAHGFPTEENTDFKIAPNVYRFPNQTFYGEEVGSYLIEEEDFILLIDGPQNLNEEHEDFIITFKKPILAFMSHNPTAGGTKILQEKYKAKIYLHKDDKNGEWLTVKPDKYIEDGFKFNEHLKVVHNPGHTPGSISLLDEKNKILFSGDHIEGSNGEVRDFNKENDGHEGNVKQRFESLKKLLKYEVNQILPFHYEMIRSDAKSALERFIKKYEK